MSKNKKISVRYLTATAMMIAISIILERLIFPTFQGQPVRFDLGNIPIVICSVLCGPVYGLVCGIASDFIGCYLNGYAPFVPLMLAPAMVGFFPGVVSRITKKSPVFFGALVLIYIAAEILWTPFGLSLMKGTPYGADFSVNLPAAALQTVVDTLIIFVIFKSKILERTGLFKR